MCFKEGIALGRGHWREVEEDGQEKGEDGDEKYESA
jgi:hypothetical protein